MVRSILKPQVWCVCVPRQCQSSCTSGHSAEPLQIPSAARAAGFTVKGHHFDSGPSFFAGLSGKLPLLPDSLSPAWHHEAAVAGLPATKQHCITGLEACSVSCSLYASSWAAP